MKWYKKILLDNAKAIFGSAATFIILVLVFLLWRFALGIKFEWQQINPLSPPSIFVRSFYSAFVFCTLGLFLYLIYFYKILHDILVKTFGLWELYNFIKAIIWAFLLYISYEYIVPWLFILLNTSVSILINIVGIILYILPPLGISLILSIVYIFFMTKTITSYKCNECSRLLKEDQKTCPYCGSNLRDIHISVAEEIKVRSSLGLKKFTQGIKDFVVHLKQGWFHSGDIKNHPDGVQLTQLIDRENNLYKKKVVDGKTGRVVKDLKEPLNQHQKK